MSTSAAPAWTPEGTLAERLALIRIHHGWNVKAAALATGIPRATWASWEAGKSPHHMQEKLRQIAERAGVDYVWLMTGRTQHTQANGGRFQGLLSALPMRSAA